MPTHTGALNRTRQVMVRVEIAPPARLVTRRRTAGVQLPGAVTVNGLVDTGANITVIDLAVRAALNLTPFRLMPLRTPSRPHPHLTPLYKVDVTVLHPSGNPQLHLVRKLLTVAATPLAQMGNDVLIGCDVLSQCRLLYDGQAGNFSLDY